MEKVTRLASENGVVIFTKSTCCLSYAVKVLLKELYVEAKVHEIDKESDGSAIGTALASLGCTSSIPIVFIGGRLVGSTNEVMSSHLNGSLLRMLRPYQNFC